MVSPVILILILNPHISVVLLFVTAFAISLVYTVLKRIFYVIPCLVYNGRVEPVWRSYPRIWSQSTTWKDFFTTIYEQDKRQINICLFEV